MARVWKQILRPGSYYTRSGPCTFTADDVRRLCRTGRRMLADGLLPPCPLEHQDNCKPLSEAERLARSVSHNAGFMRDLKVSPDGTLSALLDISWLPGSIDDDEIEHRLRHTIRYVSPEICPAFVSGDGRRYGQAITHVSLTCQPVDHQQRPFGTDGAALSRRVVRLSLADRIPPMKTTTVRRPSVTIHELQRIAAASRRRRIKMSAADLMTQEEQTPLSLDHLRNRINEAKEVMDRLAQRSALQPMTTLAAPWMPGCRAALDSLIGTVTAALEREFLGAGMTPTAAIAMSRPSTRPNNDDAVKTMLELAGVGR